MSALTCPVCGAPEPAPYWPRVWNDPGREVKRCPRCAVLFLWPLPTGQDLDAYHARYAEHLAARGVTAARETAEQTHQRRAPQQQYRVDIVRPWLRPDAHVLEVGGGCGNLLGRFLEEGLAARGTLVESCDEHRAYAASRYPGLACLAGLDDAPRDAFDAVLAMHVLEHVPDPAGFLRLCAALLKPGGLVILETPAASDPLLSLYDCAAFKDFHFQPMHPFVFHRDTLPFLAEKSGTEAAGCVHHQRYGLDNHLGWLMRGKPGGDPTLRSTLPETDKVYRRELEQAQTTDTLFGFLRKPL